MLHLHFQVSIANNITIEILEKITEIWKDFTNWIRSTGSS